MKFAFAMAVGMIAMLILNNIEKRSYRKTLVRKAKSGTAEYIDGKFYYIIEEEFSHKDKPTRLSKLPVGSLFMYDSELALKTEYVTQGSSQCYLVGSGKILSVSDLDNQIVLPITLDIDE